MLPGDARCFEELCQNLEADIPNLAQFHAKFSGICSNIEFCYMTPENSLISANSSLDFIPHFQCIFSPKVEKKKKK